MIRILLFVFIAFLCWLAIRMLTGSRRRDEAPPAEQVATPRRVETITQCAWCGVHVPPTETVALPDGRAYCSEAHRDAARTTVAPTDRTPS